MLLLTPAGQCAYPTWVIPTKDELILKTVFSTVFGTILEKQSVKRSPRRRIIPLFGPLFRVLSSHIRRSVSGVTQFLHLLTKLILSKPDETFSWRRHAPQILPNDSTPRGKNDMNMKAISRVFISALFNEAVICRVAFAAGMRIA